MKGILYIIRLVLFITVLFLEFPFLAFAQEQLTEQYGKKLNLIMISILFLFVFGTIYLMRVIFKSYKEKKEKKEQRDSQVGFMVNTFHELVQKLKDKEKELHDLKSRAEERADHIESYTDNILQSVPSGVVSFDNNLRITSVNASAERILDIRSDDCIGKSYEDVFNVPITDLIRDNVSIVREEVLYESPAHKRMWLGLNISPLRNKDGKSIGKILIFTDLTDLKALESQVKLRENLSSLGEMSAGIAHELRNPMGVIAGHTKLLSKSVSGELIGSVHAIEKEISMMDRIISDFMSFAHPINLNKTKFNLSELIREVLDNVVPQECDIETKLFLTESPVKGDETLLRQVFTNLLQNAVEAMNEDGVLIIQTAKENSVIAIDIRDNGHGISDDVRGKIFLPFYTTKEKGTGLGLAIVHKIVVSHGGTISFASSSDGTSFRIILPLLTHIIHK